MDDLYPAVTPKHEAGNPTAFTNEVQTAAEHLLAVVDGKSKEVFGGNYSQVKEVLGKIHESGYFDQSATPYEAEPEVALVETPGNHEMVPPQRELPPIEMIPFETIAPMPILAQPPVEQVPIEQQLTPEQQLYFQQQQQQQQQMQTPKPITEMLGAGSFVFLQESEIDTPPEQIPSQTFTNQSFVGGPPPPIPLPTLFQNVPTNVVPQQPMPVIGNNGIDEGLEEERKGSAPNGNGRPPRSNQSYYQNQNNGYSNRPRQNRSNGPRPSNRHNN